MVSTPRAERGGGGGTWLLQHVDCYASEINSVTHHAHTTKRVVCMKSGHGGWSRHSLVHNPQLFAASHHIEVADDNHRL